MFYVGVWAGFLLGYGLARFMQRGMGMPRLIDSLIPSLVGVLGAVIALVLLEEITLFSAPIWFVLLSVLPVAVIVGRHTANRKGPPRKPIIRRKPHVRAASDRKGHLAPNDGPLSTPL